MSSTGAAQRLAAVPSRAPAGRTAQNVLPLDVAVAVGHRLAAKRGVPPTRDAVADVPVERLLQTQAELKAELTDRPDPDV